MRKIIQYWFPAIFWAAVILAASSDLFSSAHTGSILERVLIVMFGRQPLTPAQFEMVHFLIRKAAHVIEYGIFGALAFRAVRAERAGWTASWALVAVAAALALASLDEWHQSFVPSRTPSPIDVLIDTAAAGVAQLLIRLRIAAPELLVPRS